MSTDTRLKRVGDDRLTASSLVLLDENGEHEEREISLHGFSDLASSQPRVVDEDSFRRCLDEKYTVHARWQYRAPAYNGKRLE